MAEGTTKGAAEDPSMEDILASIRSILNDEAPSVQPEAAPAAQKPSPSAVTDDVFVLDQSMLIEEPPEMVPEAARHALPPAPDPFATQPPPQKSSQKSPERSPEPQSPGRQPLPLHAEPESEPLLAPAAAAAATASMGALVRVLGQQQTQVYRGGPTLEDMVRDELRPMVKSWLDEHLAPMVERMVRAEIARVTDGK